MFCIISSSRTQKLGHLSILGATVSEGGTVKNIGFRAITLEELFHSKCSISHHPDSAPGLNLALTISPEIAEVQGVSGGWGPVNPRFEVDVACRLTTPDPQRRSCTFRTRLGRSDRLRFRRERVETR
jgi:hypothetical protein